MLISAFEPFDEIAFVVIEPAVRLPPTVKPTLVTAPLNVPVVAVNAATSNAPAVTVIPPDLSAPKPGCRFFDRCPEAMEKCKTVPPKIKTKSGYVLCWLYE